MGRKRLGQFGGMGQLGGVGNQHRNRIQRRLGSFDRHSFQRGVGSVLRWERSFLGDRQRRIGFIRPPPAFRRSFALLDAGEVLPTSAAL